MTQDHEQRPVRIHDDLVSRLVADARPVRPPWAPLGQALLWLLLEVVTVTAAVAAGLRESLDEPLRNPGFVLQVGALLAMATLLGVLALRAAIPGMVPGLRQVVTAVVLACAAVLLLGFEADGAIPGTSSLLVGAARCWAATAAFAALPWVALFTAQRRGAPLDGRVAGVLAGSASLLLAAAAVRIACPIDDRLHLLVSHALPVAVGSGLSILAGSTWLERWREP